MNDICKNCINNIKGTGYFDCIATWDDLIDCDTEAVFNCKKYTK